MKKKCEIYYLLHSGFAVKIDDRVLVFDYYQDPEHVVSRMAEENAVFYFFSSHAHYDHFNNSISKFSKQTERYFLSYDIRQSKGAEKLPEAKLVYLNEYDEYADDNISVKSYSSTDAGVSFLVTYNGFKIFHAGDFNWWHWKGDTELNNKYARNGFKKQMKRLNGLEADVVFFPTDSRLEEFAGLGAKEFCESCRTNLLVGMHAHGVEWRPEEGFFAAGKKIETWCPIKAGAEKIIIKGE